MKEYIEKDTALETTYEPFTMSMCMTVSECNGMNRAREIIFKQLRDIPAADVHPVVKGKWIIHKPFDSGRHNCNECIECSVCGTWFGHDCYEISNFCPHCGAKMDGGADDGIL